MVMSLLAWQAELAGSPADAMQKASQLLRAAGFQTQAMARTLVPVDTGFLRTSITVGHPSGRDTAPGDLEVQIGPEAAYGVYVEYGTTKRGGRPYMTPAAETVGKALEERIAKEVGIT